MAFGLLNHSQEMADAGAPILKEDSKDSPDNKKYSILFPTCNCKPLFETILHRVLLSINERLMMLVFSVGITRK